MHVQRWLLQRLISLRAGVLVALLVLMIWQIGAFSQFRLQLANIYYVQRPTNDHIVIIATDDASLGAYGRSLNEWPRTLYADLIRQLDAAGARIAVFDILFAEPTADDAELQQAIQSARDSDNRLRVVMPIVGVQQSPNTDYAIADGFLPPTPVLADEVDYLGITNVVPDIDGVVRWQLMRMQSNDTQHLGLSLSAYLAWQRIPAIAVDQLIEFDDNQLTLPGGRTIWLDDDDRVQFDYFGTPNEAFPVYSFHEVIEGRVDASAFDDKIVFIGLMNSTGQADEHLVPIGIGGQQMAGVEIHAHTLESLMQNRILQPQSRTSQAMMIILLALLSSVIYGLLPRRYYIFGLTALVLVLVLLLVLSASVLFSTELMVVNIFDAALAVVLTAPAVLAQNFLLESRLRRRTEVLLASMINATQQNLSLDDTLSVIGTDLQAMLNCSRVEIWLRDETQPDTLVCVYPFEQRDVLPDVEWATLLETRISNQKLLMPLIWRGESLGIMVAYNVRRGIRSVQPILDRFILQSAAVLANVELYNESQQLNALKTRMIRMASHDLKNPLGVITGYLEMLADNGENLPIETRTRFLRQMGRAADEMLAIVSDILDLERMRRGQIELQPFVINNKLTELALFFSNKAQDQNMTFETDIISTPLTVNGDEDQLHHAISNLIDNAIKYTPQGGSIRVSLSNSGEYAHIEVKDTGYGIPAESIPKLFQEFYRVRSKATEHIDGTGLGLSLVKAVIVSHRGKIWVESTEGKGTTFFVDIPLL